MAAPGKNAGFTRDRASMTGKQSPAWSIFQSIAPLQAGSMAKRRHRDYPWARFFSELVSEV